MHDPTRGDSVIPVDGAATAPYRLEPARFSLFGCEGRGLYDTDSARNIDLYLGLKGRHGRVLANREALLDRLAPELARWGADADLVVYPQSSRDVNAALAARIGRPTAVIPKRSKDEIIALAARLEWRRDEWTSQRRRFAAMSGVSFDLHQLKSNQRHRYVPLIFDAAGLGIAPTARVLLLDDSVFSGTTVQACLAALRACGVRDVRVGTPFWCASLIGRLGSATADANFSVDKQNA